MRYYLGLPLPAPCAEHIEAFRRERGWRLALRRNRSKGDRLATLTHSDSLGSPASWRQPSWLQNGAVTPLSRAPVRIKPDRVEDSSNSACWYCLNFPLPCVIMLEKETTIPAVDGRGNKCLGRQMSKGDVEAFLYAQLAKQGQQSHGTGNAQVGSGGEIDSLLGLELTLAIEERYGVRFAEDDLSSSLLRSIPRLAQAVATKMGGEARK